MLIVHCGLKGTLGVLNERLTCMSPALVLHKQAPAVGFRLTVCSFTARSPEPFEFDCFISVLDDTDFAAMSATHGLAIIVADAVFMAVSTAAVALRFWVRKSTSMALAADDWLIVAAWVRKALYVLE